MKHIYADEQLYEIIKKEAQEKNLTMTNAVRTMLGLPIITVKTGRPLGSLGRVKGDRPQP